MRRPVGVRKTIRMRTRGSVVRKKAEHVRRSQKPSQQKQLTGFSSLSYSGNLMGSESIVRFSAWADRYTLVWEIDSAPSARRRRNDAVNKDSQRTVENRYSVNSQLKLYPKLEYPLLGNYARRDGKLFSHHLRFQFRTD